MAKLYDLARVSTATVGTGTITLGAAVSGYLTFALAGVTDGETIAYGINDGANSEAGEGIYTSSGTTLTRNVNNSTNSNALISLSGTAQVFITPRPRDIGKLTNRRVAKSAAYTLANTEAGATVAMAGAAFYALTIPNPTGFDSDYSVMVLNEDTGRAKMVLPFYTSSATSLAIATGSKAFTVASGLVFPGYRRVRAYSLANNANWMAGLVTYAGTTLTMTVDTVGGSGTFTDWQIAPELLLWPLQFMPVFAQNNVWAWKKELYFPSADVQLNISASGNNSSDGLGLTTGALKTGTRAVQIFQQEMFIPAGNRIVDGASGTFQEFVDIEQVFPGGGPIFFQNATWKPANSGYAFQVGDWVGCVWINVTWDTSGVTSPQGYVFLHQHAVGELWTGIVVNTGGLVISAFGGDGHCKWNVFNGLTVVNSGGAISGFIYDARNPLVQLNINGAHTYTGTPVFGRFLISCMGSQSVLQGNVTQTGAVTASASYVSTNGVVLNTSGVTIPGGNPTSGTSGGQYVTAI